MTTYKCSYCANDFEAQSETDVCRDCYYAGKAHARILADVLVEVQQINANANFWQTGGGIFAIHIPLGEADAAGAHRFYLLVTDAEDGGLNLEPRNADSRWMVGFYDCEKDDGEAEILDGQTLDEVVEYGFARDALLQIAEAKRIGDLDGWDGTWEDLHGHVDANMYLVPALEAFGMGDRLYNVEGLVEERLEEIQPQLCGDCKRPIFYGTDDAWHHAANPTRGCFLIAAETRGQQKAARPALPKPEVK